MRDKETLAQGSSRNQVAGDLLKIMYSEAGHEPALRSQQYESLILPASLMEELEVNHRRKKTK